MVTEFADAVAVVHRAMGNPHAGMMSPDPHDDGGIGGGGAQEGQRKNGGDKGFHRKNLVWVGCRLLHFNGTRRSKVPSLHSVNCSRAGLNLAGHP